MFLAEPASTAPHSQDLMSSTTTLTTSSLGLARLFEPEAAAATGHSPPSLSSSCSSEDEEEDETGDLSTKGHYWQHGSDSEAALSDVSSQPELLTHMSMTESWLLTPTPIFNLGASSKQRSGSRGRASDPFENMLIEHPSMSVYKSRGKPSSTGNHDDSEESGSSSESGTSSDDSEMSALDRSIDTVAKGTKRKASVTPSASREQLAQRIERRVTRSSEAAKRAKEAKQLKKTQMKRQNHVTHKASNKPIRRKQAMAHKNSRAVNDRKSQ